MTRRVKRKRETVFLGDEIKEYMTAYNEKQKERIKKAQKGTDGAKSMNLLMCWQRVAPPRLLSHTDNVVYSTRSKNTEILVYVDSSLYAAELSMDKEIYRLRMQQETEKEIDDIKFLVSRKSAYRKTKRIVE